MKSMIKELASLVEEGGKIAMRHHGRITEVIRKGDDSPLTAADLEVDAFLCEGLARAFPEIPIVTEERVATHLSGNHSPCFFLVDPIDGTKEFLAERGEFTINIGYVENGRAVAGAVSAPAVGRIFTGARGEGAFAKDADSMEWRRLAPPVPDNDALRVVASRSHMTPETIAFIEANKVAGTVNAGSSLKFCLLAAGEADLYPRFGPTMEWDTCAGHAVLAAAGGCVEEISGEPLKYGKPDYRNPHFIAYTPGTKYNKP